MAPLSDHSGRTGAVEGSAVDGGRGGAGGISAAAVTRSVIVAVGTAAADGAWPGTCTESVSKARPTANPDCLKNPVRIVRMPCRRRGPEAGTGCQVATLRLVPYRRA